LLRHAHIWVGFLRAVYTLIGVGILRELKFKVIRLHIWALDYGCIWRRGLLVGVVSILLVILRVGKVIKLLVWVILVGVVSILRGVVGILLVILRVGKVIYLPIWALDYGWRRGLLVEAVGILLVIVRVGKVIRLPIWARDFGCIWRPGIRGFRFRGEELGEI